VYQDHHAALGHYFGFVWLRGCCCLQCLYYAVLARLSAVAVKGEYNLSLEPWNTYISSDIPLAHDTMDLLLALSKEEVEKAWKLEPS